MKPIHSRAHGILDYLVGVLLIIIPTLFGFTNGPEKWLPIVLGISTIIYSLLTDYELGALRVLPFRVHLVIDAFSGVLLALSPWLFAFADRVFVPHLILGFAELGVVMLSRPFADTPRTTTPVHVR